MHRPLLKIDIVNLTSFRLVLSQGLLGLYYTIWLLALLKLAEVQLDGLVVHVEFDGGLNLLGGHTGRHSLGLQSHLLLRVLLDHRRLQPLPHGRVAVQHLLQLGGFQGWI